LDAGHFLLNVEHFLLDVEHFSLDVEPFLFARHAKSATFFLSRPEIGLHKKVQSYLIEKKCE
jgi:hypothetical protein